MKVTLSNDAREMFYWMRNNSLGGPEAVIAGTLEAMTPEARRDIAEQLLDSMTPEEKREFASNLLRSASEREGFSE